MAGINRELLAIARDRIKAAFIDTQAVAGAAGGMPQGGDPAASAMAGPMPPMPGMPMGGDPAAMGGAPPRDPAAMGGAPPMDPAAAGMTPPAPAAAPPAPAAQPAAPAKMKVDVNTELYHIKRMLVYLLQSMGQSVPPDMLLGDPAEDPYAEPGKAQNDPASAAASPGAMESAIKPIDPMQGASPAMAQGGGQPKQAYWENGGGYGSESHARSQQAVTKLNNGVDALRALIRAQA